MFTRQSKLEHFGFDMLPRSTTLLKRQTCKEKRKPTTHSHAIISCCNKSKKMRTIEYELILMFLSSVLIESFLPEYHNNQ